MQILMKIYTINEFFTKTLCTRTVKLQLCIAIVRK